MRCPKCGWTTVSYEMETREWRCKRCRAVVTEGARPGRPLGASSQPSAPTRAAKGGAKPAVKPAAKKASARQKAGAKPARRGR